ncbi:MAG: hypothetical protein A2V70_08330 [Planctomycetes bacterium RBG_13_63_9]|nr:MAG: hypothetical protein A2V70_08330 [Planctomycetes bacterium RBG_13_63_9]
MASIAVGRDLSWVVLWPRWDFDQGTAWFGSDCTMTEKRTSDQELGQRRVGREATLGSTAPSQGSSLAYRSFYMFCVTIAWRGIGPLDKWGESLIISIVLF